MCGNRETWLFTLRKAQREFGFPSMQSIQFFCNPLLRFCAFCIKIASVSWNVVLRARAQIFCPAEAPFIL